MDSTVAALIRMYQHRKESMTDTPTHRTDSLPCPHCNRAFCNCPANKQPERSAGDAALLAEAANMLEQVIEAAEIAMKDVNAESSSDVWDVNHLLGPARGVLARCRAAHAAENIPATSPTLEMVKQAKEAIEENTRSPKEPQTVEHGWGGTGPKPSAPHAEAQQGDTDAG